MCTQHTMTLDQLIQQLKVHHISTSLTKPATRTIAVARQAPFPSAPPPPPHSSRSTLSTVKIPPYHKYMPSTPLPLLDFDLYSPLPGVQEQQQPLRRRSSPPPAIHSLNATLNTRPPTDFDTLLDYSSSRALLHRPANFQQDFDFEGAAFREFRLRANTFRSWASMAQEARANKVKYEKAVERWLKAVSFFERRLCSRCLNALAQHMAQRRRVVESALAFHPMVVKRQILREWRIVVVYEQRARRGRLWAAFRRFCTCTGHACERRTIFIELGTCVRRWRLRYANFAFDTWRCMVAEVASLARVAAQIASYHMQYLVKAIFFSWQRYLTSMQRLRLNVLRLFGVRRLRYAYAALVKGCSISRRQDADGLVLFSRMMHRDKLVAMSRWLSFAKAMVNARASLQKCVKMWTENQRLICLRAWERHATRTAESMELIGRALATMRLVGLRRSLNKLNEVLNQRYRMVRALARFRADCLATAWSRWHHRSLLLVNSNLHLHSILCQVVCQRLGKAWRSWMEALCELEANFNTAIRRLVHLAESRAVNTWLAFSNQKRAALRTMRSALSQWGQSILSKCIRGWAKYTTLRRSRRHRNRVAWSHRANHVVCSHLSAWRQVFDRVLGLEQVGIRLILALQMRLVRKAINSWLLYSSNAAIVTRVHLHSRQLCRAAALRIWQTHAAQCIENQELLHTAVSVFSHPRTSAAWHSWNAWIWTRRKQLQLIHRVITIFRFPCAPRFFRAWRDGAKFRKAANQLIRTFKFAIKAAVLSAWFGWARRRCHCREVEATLASQRNDQVRSFTLRRWGFRTFLTARVANLLRVWGISCSASTVFRAWSNFTLVQVVHRMDAVATFYSACESRRRAFRRWYSLVQQGLKHQLASLHRRNNLVLFVLRAWSLRTRARASKRVMKQDAEKFRLLAGFKAIQQAQHLYHFEECVCRNARFHALHKYSKLWASRARFHSGLVRKIDFRRRFFQLAPRVRTWANCTKASLATCTKVALFFTGTAGHTAIHKWTILAGEYRNVKSCISTGYKHWAARQRHLSVAHWLEFARRRTSQRRAMHSILLFWANIKIRTFLGIWIQSAAKQRQAIQLMHEMIQRWAKLAMHRAVEHWACLVQQADVYRNSISSAVARWGSLSTKITMLRWREFALDHQRQRVKLEQAVRLAYRCLLYRYFAGLALFLRLRRQARAAAVKVAARMAHRLEALVWHGWTSFLDQRRAIRKRANNLHKRTILRDEHHAVLLLALNRRAAMLQMRHRYLRVRREWKDRQTRLKHWRLLARSHRSLLKRVLEHWKLVHDATIAYRAALIRAHAQELAVKGHARKMRARALFKAVATWHHFGYQQSKRTKIVLLLDKRRLLRMAVHVFTTWTSRVRRAHLLRALVARIMMNLCVHCLEQWRIFLAAQNKRQDKMCKAQQFRAKSWAREILVHWRALILSYGVQEFTPECKNVEEYKKKRDEFTNLGRPHGYVVCQTPVVHVLKCESFEKFEQSERKLRKYI